MRAPHFIAAILLASPLASCGGQSGSPTGDDSSSDGTTAASTSGGADHESSGRGTDPIDGTSAAGLSSDATSSAESSSDGMNRPEAEDDIVYAKQDQAVVVPAAEGLLANDVDPDGDPLNVVDFDAASQRGGTIFVEVDGSVMYTPPAGFWGDDGFGYSVSDGIETTSAAVTVYVAPVRVPLSSVTAGQGGFAIDGHQIVDRSGSSVDDAGDVNGDGVPDLVVGSENHGCFVVFGKMDAEAVQLADVTNGTGGFYIWGLTEEAAGPRARGAGDVNGDGLGDILIGATGINTYGPSTHTGGGYIVFGRADTSPVALVDVAAGSGGFVIEGEPSTWAGYPVSPAGDVNGDGHDDVVFGVPAIDANGPGSGRSYVVFGKAGTELISLTDIAAGLGGFAIDGEAAGDSSGESVGGAGDVNGDGLADVVVGATHAAPGGVASGRSYLVFGKADTETVQLADIAAGLGGFALDGEALDDGAGSWVDGAGDVDGDGLADVLVYAGYADPNGVSSGRGYVVFGKADTGNVSLADVTAGIGGYVLDGEGEYDGPWARISSAGDVNADGLADVIVGSYNAGPNNDAAGRTYVVYGKADTAAIPLSTVEFGVVGFVLDGEAAADDSGISVSGAGDVDGDGVADVIIGAREADPNATSSGRSYVVFGVPTAPT